MEASFKPSNHLNFDTVPTNREQLIKMIARTSASEIQIDLSMVSQCDSAGLALLIEAKKLSHQSGKSIKLSGMPEPIQALAKFCGVETMLADS